MEWVVPALGRAGQGQGTEAEGGLSQLSGCCHSSESGTWEGQEAEERLRADSSEAGGWAEGGPGGLPDWAWLQLAGGLRTRRGGHREFWLSHGV